jgi:two-component system nitrate/nitrite response regulator NarL
MAPALPPERILIVDDHTLFGQALRSALERRGIEVLAVVGNGQDALGICREQRPSMALVDLGLPDMSGLALGSAIIRESPATKVIAVTGMRDQSTFQLALESGFHGYLTKDSRLRDVVESIEAVRQGRAGPLPVLHTSGTLERQGVAAAVRATRLTPREREVLRLLAEGRRNDEIAKRLSIARNTVRTHVQSILLKLGVHSRLEAVALASRYRLYQDDQSSAGG